MDKIVKILIPITILFIPAYLVKFSILGIPTNALEILVLAIFILALLDRQRFNYKEFYGQNKGYLIAIILILAGLVISTLANGEYRTGFGMIKGWFIVPLFFAWVLLKEMKRAEDLKNALKWLYISTFFVALAGLGYFFTGYLTYDGRLEAFYGSPNYLAMYLAPGIIIGAYLIKNQSQNLKSKVALSSLIISFVIILISFYLAYSYAAWMAVVLSLIITELIINRRIGKKAILTGLIIILFVIASQWNTEKLNNLKIFSRSSLESRMMIWKSSEKILSDNFIFGIGPGNFQNKYLEYQKYFSPYLEWAVPQPHNLYLAFWLQSGLLGIVGFLMLGIKWLRTLLALIGQQKNSEIVAVFIGTMVYILIHGLLDTLYWKNDLAMVFWIIIFLGLAAKSLKADPV